MTPEHWRKVRIEPAAKPKRWNLLLYYTHLPIGQAAKECLGLPLETENLTLKTGLEVGELFEQALLKVEEAVAPTHKKKRLK